MHKRFIEGKKAVFFDLDGTLAETHPYWIQAFINVIASSNAGATDAEQIFEPTPGISVQDQWELVLEG